MLVQARSITEEELVILLSWEQADNIGAYIRARILQLSEDSWPGAEIATAMGINIDTVNQVIHDFNREGIPAIAARPAF
jgi:hypothetical protein